MKLAFDPVLSFVGLLNLGKKRNWIDTFLIGVWSRGNIVNTM